MFIETKNQGGGLTDGPFDLAVTCGATGTQYAVVGYTANLVRSTSGTTLTTPGTGQYDIKFPAAVNGCAFLTTVGDPGNGVFASLGLAAASLGTRGDPSWRLRAGSYTFAA